MSLIGRLFGRKIHRLADRLLEPTYGRLDVIDQKLNAVTHQNSSQLDVIDQKLKAVTQQNSSRLDVIDQKLNAVTQQNTSMARTQTALLEALLYLVDEATKAKSEIRAIQLFQEAGQMHLRGVLDALAQQTTQLGVPKK